MTRVTNCIYKKKLQLDKTILKVIITTNIIPKNISSKL